MYGVGLNGFQTLAGSNVGGGERPMDPKEGCSVQPRTDTRHAALEGAMRGDQMSVR